MSLTNDDQKPAEVKKAEAQGGQTFDPTATKEDTQLPADACVDCRGDGIRDPQATQVCSTCQGTGKA